MGQTATVDQRAVCARAALMLQGALAVQRIASVPDRIAIVPLAASVLAVREGDVSVCVEKIANVLPESVNAAQDASVPVFRDRSLNVEKHASVQPVIASVEMIVNALVVRERTVIALAEALASVPMVNANVDRNASVRVVRDRGVSVENHASVQPMIASVERIVNALVVRERTVIVLAEALASLPMVNANVDWNASVRVVVRQLDATVETHASVEQLVNATVALTVNALAVQDKEKVTSVPVKTLASVQLETVSVSQSVRV